MNKVKVLTMTTFATAMLASCSSEVEPSETSRNLAGTPIHVNVVTNGLVESRAGYDTDEQLKNSSFGLFLTTEGTTEEAYNANNQKYTYDEGWTSNKQLLWKNDNAQVTYYAYMPYSANAVGGDGTLKTDYQLSVDEVQTAENILASDFLYAQEKTVTAANSENGISVAFDHKLSQLKVNLKFGNEIEDLNITSVNIDGGCALSTTINLQTGEVASVTESGSSSITLAKTSEDDDKNWECLLVPQTINNLSITIEGKTGEVKRIFKYTSDAAKEFKSGYSHDLNLTIGRDKVEFANFQAIRWGETPKSEQLGTE